MNATEQASLTRGYAVGVVSAMVLSTTGILIRHLTQDYGIPPLVLAFWRNAFVVTTLVTVLGLTRPALLRVPRAQLGYLVAYGFVLALFNAFLTFSVALNGAAVSTVLVYCSAAFTALLGRWLLAERLTWPKLLAIALSIGGCGLTAGVWGRGAGPTGPVSAVTAAGIVTGVFSGLMYAAYSLMGRSASSGRGLNPWTTIVYTFGSAAAFQLAANLIPGTLIPGTAGPASELLWLGRSGAGWLALFVLGAGPTVIGFGLYNVTLGLLPSSAANLLLTLEVPCTVLIAYLALGERLNTVQVQGSLLILAGVLLLRLYGDTTEARTGQRLHAKEAGLVDQSPASATTIV
jgi:drug/metabolite transporter (DMT)-like permease